MHRALSLVAFVLRRQAGADADALLELTEAVSSFLGPDRNLSLADACGFGSTRLLDWMWSASAASKDERTSAWTLGNYLRCEPKYRRWQFQKAVQKAAAQGDLGLLTWLFAHFSGCSVPVLAVEDAAQNGHLEVLKFLLEHDAGRDCTHRRVEKPSGDKHVPYESVPQMPEGWDGPGNAVRWGSRSIEYAVAKGHKDVAKWLFLHAPHENSADDIKVIIERCLTAGFRDLANFVLPLGRSVLEYAPFCPRPEIIEMMLRSGYLRLDKRCAASAIEDSARAGRLDVMQRVAQLFSPLPPPTQMDFDWTSCWYLSIKEACTLGDIAMVKWLVGHPTGREICAELKHDIAVDHFLAVASEAGQVEVMQCLYQEGIVEQYPEALIRAVRNGHLDAVKWLVQHHSYLGGVAIDSVIDEAAKNGRLEILAFLQRLGGSMQPANAWWPRSRNAMNLAAANGHLPVVKWLHAIEAQHCTTRAMDEAATNGHLDVAQWLHRHRLEGCTTSAMDGAASNGHLTTLQWLFANTKAGCSTKAMELAAANGYLVIVKWLFEIFSLACTHFAKGPACTSKTLDEAASKSHVRVVHWIHSHFPGIIPTTDLMIYPPNQFEMVMFVHASYPEMFSTWYQKKKPLVGILIGPDDRLVVDWVVEQNPHFTMLPAGTGEPGTTIHREYLRPGGA
ncbi:hypothetical protein ON010_g11123 [Phytophthora cinnamomi]|nr:hypothetical protein ON010_g11123 [Phytophthora cinnamomi]